MSVEERRGQTAGPRASRTGCKVICKAAVLLEEGGHPGEDLLYLERLPVFPG